MSDAPFEIQLPETEHYLSAINRFNASHAAQFVATQRWIKRPIRRTAAPMEGLMALTEVLFERAVLFTTATAEEELPNVDKTLTLLSLYYGSDKQRVTTLKDLLPGVEVEYAPDNKDFLTVFITECLDDGSHEPVAEALSYGYKEACNYDYVELAEAVAETPQGRVVGAIHEAPRIALGVGTIAAGVALGNIASKYVPERFRPQ